MRLHIFDRKSDRDPAAAIKIRHAQTTASWFRRPKVIIALASCLSIAAIITFVTLQRSQRADSQILPLSGRIEAPETYIAAAMPARVKFVAVKEGDPVHKGQLIISLDAQVIQSKMKEADSYIASAQEAQRRADLQVTSVEGVIKKARAQAEDEKRQTISQFKTVQSDISKAKAQSKGFWAQLFSTKKKKAEKTAQLREEMTQAQMQAKKVKAGIVEKTAQLRQEMTQAQMQKFRAEAIIARAQAAKTEASSKLSYFNITSPLDGICARRSIEPGQLASRGQVMLTLTNPNSAYMRGFIPEGRMEQVKIGQRAQVFLDSYRNKPFSARVTSIDTEPCFTPENVYFKQDRVRQTFGVKLSIDHPGGSAKPGMPADAQIMLSSLKSSR